MYAEYLIYSCVDANGFIVLDDSNPKVFINKENDWLNQAMIYLERLR